MSYRPAGLLAALTSAPSHTCCQPQIGGQLSYSPLGSLPHLGLVDCWLVLGGLTWDSWDQTFCMWSFRLNSSGDTFPWLWTQVLSYRWDYLIWTWTIRITFPWDCFMGYFPETYEKLKDTCINHDSCMSVCLSLRESICPSVWSEQST